MKFLWNINIPIRERKRRNQETRLINLDPKINIILEFRSGEVQKHSVQKK